jgi:beta-glucosidase
VPPSRPTVTGIGIHPEGLREILERVHALSGGVPLIGFFPRSFLDNFEWASGNGVRYGLYYVDYASQERLPKRSADWYREVIRNNGL